MPYEPLQFNAVSNGILRLKANSGPPTEEQSNWLGRLGRPGGPAPVVRWLFAGLVFLGVNTFFLKVFVGWFGLSILWGTFLAAELSTILRFFVNEHWVFGNRRPSWDRLWRYQVANAGALLLWWAATNILASHGVQYLLAGILAVGLSTGFSLASNFFWIWRKRHHKEST
jgi:putative flippase GtrA